jgi:hypothetical protein
LDAPEFIEYLRPSDLSVDILSICRPIPASVQVLWPQQTIANFVYKCFPDLFLRTKGGARTPIPLLEDLVNREEFQAWMLWDRTELEHIPYYSTRRQRYAGMDRQEKAQMGSDKAFDHLLGTGRGKDDTWHAAMHWREEMQNGRASFPTDADAPKMTPSLQQNRPLSIARN